MEQRWGHKGILFFFFDDIKWLQKLQKWIDEQRNIKFNDDHFLVTPIAQTQNTTTFRNKNIVLKHIWSTI